MMARRWLLFMLALGVSAGASAQEPYRDARVLYVEPGVSMQRAAETGAEEAVPNVPFLPGDRVWTDHSGRAEFQFADGTLLRVDRRSKLDYVARDDGRREHVFLRLWSGGLYVQGRNPEISVETPGGIVEIGRAGIYRIDVDSGETRLSVYEGEADIDATRVRAGERAYARRGEAVEGPERFDRAARDTADESARWDQQRGEGERWAGARPEYLPEEVAPYAGELEANGTWYYESEVGNVWRPHVGPGWQPYMDGRWIWTAYGWTWVPSEAWGWAPFHYGRWGHSASLGWYWVPSAGWGPAWVSWAVGPSYVGWCPMGYRNQPVAAYDRGRAVPRGSVPATSPWTFVRRADLNTRDWSRRRVQAVDDLAQQVRVIESPRARLTRDVQLGDDRAVPRNVRARPGVGAPLAGPAADPTAAIPAAAPRMRFEPEREAERRRPPVTEQRTEPPRTESPDREVMRPVFRPLGRAEQDRERSAPSAPPSGDARSGAERRRPESTPRAQPQPPTRTERPSEARPAPPAQPRERAEPRKKDN